MKTALVLGAGGFVGGHMVKRLRKEGYWVRGVDIKTPEFSSHECHEFLTYDLRDPDNVKAVLKLEYNTTIEHGRPAYFNYLDRPFFEKKPFDEVYQFAADMGGAGYVFTGKHDADIMHNSALINLNVLSNHTKFKKIFYSSSACMYPQELQNNKPLVFENGEERNTNVALKESDAYPANPDSEYGWEKLFSERLYLAYARNHNVDVRIARFHNIYGPEGTYEGGREKAPAAMCRKVVECLPKWYTQPPTDLDKKVGIKGRGIMEWRDNIEVWGNGQQTRSFLYIDDCIDAVRLLMQSEHKEPINIGSEEMISINDLAKMVIGFSGKDIEIKNIPGPVGVNGRNSDNDLIRKVLNWEPKYTLKEGMEKTYNWIKSQYANLT